MRHSIRIINILLVTLLLSGCQHAANAFFAAGDSLFQPGGSSLEAMPTLSVNDLVRPYNSNPAKANKAYLGKWVKVRGVVADIRKRDGIAGSYFYTLKLKDEANRTNEVLTFIFNAHNFSDIESLETGKIATVLAQVHQVGENSLPQLENPKVLK